MGGLLAKVLGWNLKAIGQFKPWNSSGDLAGLAGGLVGDLARDLAGCLQLGDWLRTCLQ